MSGQQDDHPPTPSRERLRERLDEQRLAILPDLWTAVLAHLNNRPRDDGDEDEDDGGVRPVTP